MNWETLLSTERYVAKSTAPDESQSERRNAFQRDFDRIAYSTPFRRLQNKTQVHTLPNNDHVRNRLTHSLEASTVARSLGTGIGTWLKAKGYFQGAPELVGSCAAAATLAHDIGNPPFGHPGEAAIQDWFKYSDTKEHVLCLSDAEKANFTRFNGNAQGFRVLTKYDHGYDSRGLQLTCGTLAAFNKYPTSTAAQGRYKDVGVFTGDIEAFRIVAERTGLPELDSNSWARHPLAFVVEAADDIAYLTADVEDAVELGLIPAAEAKVLFHSLSSNSPLTPNSPLNRLRSVLIGNLIEEASSEFRRDHDCIIQGRREHPLLKDCAATSALKKVAKERIFASRGQLLRDIAGRDALNGILKRISTTVCDFKQSNWSLTALRNSAPHKWRLLCLIDEADPETAPLSKLSANTADCEVLHIIVDYVAGQTDRYAADLWQSVRALDL